jgi:ribonuclease VapC
MVIDSSAIVAILHREPERQAFLTAILNGSPRLVSAVTKLEIGMVAVGHRGPGAAGVVDALLRDLGIQVVPFDDQQADLAREAFPRYGKGRHRARLNFGDCAAYALAIAEAEALLFKGTDFGATDVEVVKHRPVRSSVAACDQIRLPNA